MIRDAISAAEMLEVIAQQLESAPEQFGGVVHIESITGLQAGGPGGGSDVNINTAVHAPANEVIGANFQTSLIIGDQARNEGPPDALAAASVLRDLANDIREEEPDGDKILERLDRLAELTIPVLLIELTRLAARSAGIPV